MLPFPNTGQLGSDSSVMCISSPVVIKPDLIGWPGILPVRILAYFHFSDNHSEKILFDSFLLNKLFRKEKGGGGITISLTTVIGDIPEVVNVPFLLSLSDCLVLPQLPEQLRFSLAAVRQSGGSSRCCRNQIRIQSLTKNTTQGGTNE